MAPRSPERLPMMESINPASAKTAPKKGTGAITTEVQPKLAPRMVVKPPDISVGGGGVIGTKSMRAQRRSSVCRHSRPFQIAVWIIQ